MNLIHYHSKERVRFIKDLPCCVCGNTPSDGHHIISKGAGGTWRDVVPLCRLHHNEYHNNIVKFGNDYNLDLRKIADELSSYYYY